MLRNTLAGLAVVLGLVACAAAPPPAPLPPVAASAVAPAPRPTGTQHRTYDFADAGAEMPYRLYVPTSWDGRTRLPLILFLHGGGSDENRYLDANDRQLEKLAEAHGYILVAPLGYSRIGAYGAAMTLRGSFGDLAGQAAVRAGVNANPARLRELQLSERDTLNVLDRTIAEYGVDPAAVFLMGHSMGSGGAWYLANKYPARWAAVAPMSGPFAEAALEPFANLKGKPIYYTEGIQTPSLAASRAMHEAARAAGLDITYREFDADHGGMVPLAAPGVFEFFDAHRRRR